MVPSTESARHSSSEMLRKMAFSSELQDKSGCGSSVAPVGVLCWVAGGKAPVMAIGDGDGLAVWTSLQDGRHDDINENCNITDR